MTVLLLTVPLAPLLTVPLILAAGRKLPFGGGELTLAGSLFSLLALLFPGRGEWLLSTVWLHSGSFTLTAGLQLTRLSGAVALMVAGVSAAVNLYAMEYMKAEAGRPRFFALMSFFLAAMLTLVLSSSLLLFFAAWEAVGLASFLLIGFWYRRPDARQGAQRAFLFTRLGDIGLLLGWLWVMLASGTTRIDTFLQQAAGGAFPPAVLTAIAGLFLAGAVGKSAQLPLSAWLPSAMAGPTPVSALIHSATMVAAGVYLVLRFFPLFEMAPAILPLIFWIGGLTALFAALLATVQTDLKKILAWSTSSQLGEMFFALGLAGPLAAAYHLFTHAAFKSTLFLAAGAVDHAAGTRRIDRLSGLKKTLPVTALVFAAAALALAGVPPFSGFWSEDKILAAAVHRNPLAALWMLALVFLAGVYISRAATAVFTIRPGESPQSGHPPGRLLRAAMILLGLAAVFAGWLLHSRIEALLPFAAGPLLNTGWKIAAVLCAAGGLALGAVRVKSAGAAPALGTFPVFLERGLESGIRLTGALFLRLARLLNRVEQALDALVRGIVTAAAGLARAGNRAENLLDRLAHSLGILTLGAADGSGRAELAGFSRQPDRFAGLLSRTGAQLRRLQSGKLYLYTLGLFVWVFLFSLLGVFLWF